MLHALEILIAAPVTSLLKTHSAHHLQRNHQEPAVLELDYIYQLLHSYYPRNVSKRQLPRYKV
jgi:hypothetical protein